MTYTEAASTAHRLIMASLRLSVWEEVLNLIEQGHDPDETIRAVMEGISDEAVEVLRGRVDTLTRALLDPKAPARLQ